MGMIGKKSGRNFLYDECAFIFFVNIAKKPSKFSKEYTVCDFELLKNTKWRIGKIFPLCKSWMFWTFGPPTGRLGFCEPAPRINSMHEWGLRHIFSNKVGHSWWNQFKIFVGKVLCPYIITSQIVFQKKFNSKNKTHFSKKRLKSLQLSNGPF